METINLREALPNASEDFLRANLDKRELARAMRFVSSESAKILGERKERRSATRPRSNPEEKFGRQIEHLFRLYHWRFCHFRPGMTSRTYINRQGEEKSVWLTNLSGDPGMTDYFAIRPPRVLVVEIKADGKKLLTKGQVLWKLDLEACPWLEYYLWSPEDWEAIVKVLR